MNITSLAHSFALHLLTAFAHSAANNLRNSASTQQPSPSLPPAWRPTPTRSLRRERPLSPFGSATSRLILIPEYYTISPDHDLITRVIEHADVTRTEGEGNAARTSIVSVPKKAHEFRVRRDVVAQSSVYFCKLLNGNFKEAEQIVVDMHDDTAVSLKVWLKLMYDTTTDDTHALSIKDIWDALLAAEKYGFDPQTKRSKMWFASWFEAQEQRTASDEAGWRFDLVAYQQLLFPCHSFDYASGFLSATKYLIYNDTRHIVERRPNGFRHDHLRLNQSIIQQVNAARGRLKTILHRSLYRPIDNLLQNADCDCRATVLYAYEKGLANTGAWPLETSFVGNSVNGILDLLMSFASRTTPSTCGLPYCTFSFASVVARAREECKESFDGLCLDCMDASKPKLRDSDEDYWAHARPQYAWDSECRVDHGQPTWYFSFMGRREKMIQWTHKKRKRRDSDDSD